MKLFNKTIDRQLFKQYTLGSDLSKQEVVVKIFNPSGVGSWYILNSDPQDPDYLWAIVDLGYGAEVGSVSRNDLESYRSRFALGFERDLGFDPINAEELYKGLRQGKFYADGGEITEEDYEKRLQYLKMIKNNERSAFGKYNIDKEIRQINTILEHRKNFKNSYADGGLIQITKNSLPKEEVLYNFKKIGLDGKVQKESVGFVYYNKNLGGAPVFVNNKNDDFDYQELQKTGFTHYKKEFADGGELNDFSDNQRMIMNQNVEVEHHYEELEDILEDKVPVPAWVVAKMETATQNLSDITHYLDGKKEIMEDQLEEDNDDDDDDEIQNKEVVEPINVTAETKAEMTKKFADQAFGNLKGFLKGMEEIELRDDYTFDYKDEQFEIEPIINSDQNGVSNAVFTIFDSDGEEEGEVAYSREGGKQKFTANSAFFGWDRAKFEDGGFMNNIYADGGYFDDEFDGIAYAKTKGKESINWDKELRDYVGSDYSKFTQREKEEIISDMQRDWDRSNSYAKGGVTYFNNDNQHRLGRPSGSFEKEIYSKVKDRIDADDFVGSFGWKIVSGKKSNIADGFLYKLDDYDQNLIKNLNLKQGEKVFRYVNRTTAIGGMMPFIKINIEKALLYFPVSNDNDDIIFETRGITPLWINLIEGVFADGGSTMDIYANGGQIQVGDRYKFNWTDTEGNKGYTIREIVKQNVTSGKDFRTKVMIMKVVESSMPETVGRMEEEYKPSFKKAIERGMEISMQEGKPRMTDDDYAKGGDIENDGYNLKDINGKKINVGDTVRTTQPSGGLMNPANPEIGIVEKTKDAFGDDALQIKYRKQGANYDRFILLNGKVNEIVKKADSFAKGGEIDSFIPEVGEIDTFMLKSMLIKNPNVKSILSDKEFEFLKNGNTDVIGVSGKPFNTIVTDGNQEVEFDLKKNVVVKHLTEARDKIKSHYFTNYAKGGSLKKYILKADIKTVTIKRNGKEVTYKGADVLNGANLLAKGGGLTTKANYIAKRDVVNVELKDGSKIKPVNGYWVKKDAEPIGAEPTPNSSSKSATKVGQTYIKKGAYGWSATTNIDDFNDYDWRISTIKTSSGQLITSAKGGKSEDGDGYTTFNYKLYEDPYHTLEVSKPTRLTDKVVSEQHAKGLTKFKKFMETGMFGGGGKISNFDKLSDKVAKQYEGKSVKNQYQEEYGKYYSREEAQEVGDKVAGKVKAMQTDNKAFGGLFKSVKNLANPKQKYPNLEGKQVFLKTGELVQVFTQSESVLSVLEVGKMNNSGTRPYKINISEVDMTNFKAGGQTESKKSHSGSENLKQANDLAKKIRMDGESWLDARKRAFAQLKKKNEA